MRIGICGHSGSGKTTIAKWLSEKTDIPFIASSASLMFTEEDRALLKSKYGYEPLGHSNVINMGHANPEFGKEFQFLLLRRRQQLYERYTLPTTLGDSFIVDRTPIDNLVYGMLEAGNNFTQAESKYFIESCLKAFYENFTHLIFIPYCGQEIEDNNSRVPNKYFQQMVDSLFKYYLNHWVYSSAEVVPIYMVDTWDLGDRKEGITDFLFKR